MVVSPQLVANDTALIYHEPAIDPVPLTLDYNYQEESIETEIVEEIVPEEEILKDEIVEETIEETSVEESDKDNSNDKIIVLTSKETTEITDNDETHNEALDIIDNTEIIDEVNFEEKNENISEPKVIELPLTPGIETGLEIQFTSLKLKEFPIAETNIMGHTEPIEVVNLANSNIAIGDFTLYNAGVKICSYPRFKIIEFKTREFKIGLSVGLYNGDTLKAEGEYFYYEIFNHLKNSRLSNIADIFKKIFTGEVISFEINDLKGEISFENRLQFRKFTIIQNAVGIYHRISKKLKLSKNKNLSEAPISFYTLYLLDQYVQGTKFIDTWINFGIDNDKDIRPGDSIIFSKVHTLDMKGINFNLKETIRLKEPITELELSHIKDRVTCYKKTVTIELETIEKK